MLEHFRRNCPEAFAVKGIVQSCPFADCVFDAAVAWGVMFHLNPEDAIRAIANVSRIVKRGAPFLSHSDALVSSFQPRCDMTSEALCRRRANATKQ